MPATAIWLILIIVFIIGEVVTMGLTCVWFAVGALAGLFTAWLGGAVWLQLVFFAAISAAALATIRPLTTRFFVLRRAPTNADRVIGSVALVTEEIDNAAGTGQAKILGQVWTARSQLGVVIPTGAQVKVLRIEGVKVIVEAI